VEFPYGKAPFWILVTAVFCGALTAFTSLNRQSEKPELVMAIFSKEHYDAYKRVIPEFESQHGCVVQLQLVERWALWSRLQSALLAGTLLAIIPPAILFFYLQREFISGLTSGAVKG
jgi:ABC-type glycerol-3-phosphate transport system substrate-binding protein